ncbi:TPA: hypothetical protein ACGO9S_001959 [Streptococcus suis]
MALYDIPKTSITRAKSKFDNGEPFVIKNKLHYEEIEGDVVITIDAIAQSIKEQKSKPRYILVNDYFEGSFLYQVDRKYIGKLRFFKLNEHGHLHKKSDIIC